MRLFNRRGAAETVADDDRRRLLRGVAAGALAGIGVTAAGTGGPAAASRSATTPEGVVGPVRVRSSAQLIDEQDEQRWLLTDTKPPVHMQGRTYPPEYRQSPDDASYLVFNDQNQDEKGGIIAHSSGAQIALDYPNVQGATMNTRYEGNQGVSQLFLNQMPDPTIPPDELPEGAAPIRAALAVTNFEVGAFFYLADETGQKRIVLSVDDDGAKIQILDEKGELVAQLPSEAPAKEKASRLRSRLFGRLGS